LSTVIHLTQRLTSGWENASHEFPSHRFLLHCCSRPSRRTVAACAHGNSGGTADLRQAALNRPRKQKATPKDGFMLAQLFDLIGYVGAFGVTPGFLPGAGRGM
jgi:hypothetical protein